MAFVLSCPHYPACSGCSEIGSPHEVQVDRKLARVRRLFRRAAISGFDQKRIKKITANFSVEGAYRNRVKLVPSLRRGAEREEIGEPVCEREAWRALPDAVLHGESSDHDPAGLSAGGQETPAAMPRAAAFATPYLRSHEALQRETLAHADLRIGRIKLGLYRAGSHDVVDIPGCPVQVNGLNRTIEVVRDGIETCHVDLYDEIAHTGDLRYVSVRQGVHTGDVLVGFVTRTRSFAGGDHLTHYVLDRASDVVGVVQNINPDRGNVIFGAQSRVLGGRDYVEEIVCGVRIRLGLTSFFQVNTPIAERAYKAIARRLRLMPDVTLLDLYCGVGSIGLVSARRVNRVIGIEEVAESVELARAAAVANGLRNVSFEQGLVEERLGSLASDLGGAADHCDRLAVAVNPPRKGLGAAVVRMLARVGPLRIAYLSCNPHTLIRDLSCFAESGYTVKHVELFDMFPQTQQVETLAILERTRRG